jgi:hypothetical protein
MVSLVVPVLKRGAFGRRLPPPPQVREDLYGTELRAYPASPGATLFANARFQGAHCAPAKAPRRARTAVGPRGVRTGALGECLLSAAPCGKPSRRNCPKGQSGWPNAGWVTGSKKHPRGARTPACRVASHSTLCALASGHTQECRRCTQDCVPGVSTFSTRVCALMPSSSRRASLVRARFEAPLGALENSPGRKPCGTGPETRQPRRGVRRPFVPGDG